MGSPWESSVVMIGTLAIGWLAWAPTTILTDIDLGVAADVEEIWRIKFRSGYKIGQGLAYGTAGYANADTDVLGDDDGYFIGAGYEQRLAPNFSLGGELIYHEFDNFNSTTTDIDATTVQVRGTFRF